ncbi:MAG: LysM peptidoglycan-binding domain-containing protein [Cryobacterium sp.]|nr:LysM peptidoglycan-binding domain-containing protein [Cryobacterium sp.]
MAERDQARSAARGRHAASRGSGRLGVFHTPKDGIARGLLGTIPILVAGTMTMGMALTGPIAPLPAGKANKPKDSTGNLREAIRDAMERQAAEARANAAHVTDAVVTIASVSSTYTVKAGDTVSGIATRHGLSTASVLALNGLGWSSLIFPGQILKLTNGVPAATPAPAPTPAPPPTTQQYTIVTGDTISAIAARFGVSTVSVLNANGLGWSSLIFPGQRITIPAAPATTPAAPETPTPPPADETPVDESPVEESPVDETPVEQSPAPEPEPTPPPAPAPYVYTIKSGDTISGIATRHGVSTQAVLTANGLGWSTIIYPGQTIIIPGATAPAGSTPGATPLTAEMADNARVIIAVGRSLGVPEYGIIIALATAMQESSLRNLNWGDRDSIGLFQQRPSQGWGTVEQIMNREFAALAFYGGPSNPNKGKTRGLLDYAGWQNMTLTVAAQTVQKSAYPDAYAKWEFSARAWFAELG